MNDRTQEMIRMKEDGMSYSAVGKEYGLSKQRIHQVIRKFFPNLSRGKPRSKRTVKKCIVCGKEFSVTSSQIKRKFCGRECFNNWQRIYIKKKFDTEERRTAKLKTIQLRKTGMSYHGIGKAIGIPAMTAWNYMNKG